MQVRRVGAAQGSRWVLGGFRLLATKPLALLALVIFDVFLLLMPSVLPIVGPLVPTLLTPVFGVGLMVAMRETDRGGNPGPQMLFAAFGEAGGHAWRNLLVLGAISAIATMGAVALTALADGGALFDSVTGMEEGVAPVAGTDGGTAGSGTGAGGDAAAGAGDAPGAGAPLVLPDISPALLVFLLLLLPIQAGSWYAPLFIAWHRIPVAKSIFFSFVAVWRNKAAFAVYIVAWIAAVVAISTVVSWLMLLTGVSTITSMLLFFMSLAILTAMYGSVWLSYRDVIEAGARDEAPPDAGPPAGAAGG